MKKIWLLYIIIAIIIITILPFLIIQTKYRFFNNRDIEPKVAIVFGAGLVDTQPSKVLASRLDVAIDLYKNKRIEKILVSGDNTSIYYNEPKAMLNYLIENGVNENDVIPDYAGRSTVDSCYRAKFVFNINKAYLISQSSHLGRALFLCERYGIESKTLAGTNQPISGVIQQYIREIPSSFKALIESIYYNKAEPSDGSEIKINQ
jgi:SanA protein